jgi:hypothetical protein
MSFICFKRFFLGLSFAFSEDPQSELRNFKRKFKNSKMRRQLSICLTIFSVLLLAELSFSSQRMYPTYRSLTRKLNRHRKMTVNTRKYPTHHRGKLHYQGQNRISDDEEEPHEVIWKKQQRRKQKRKHHSRERYDTSNGLDDVSIREVKQSRIEDQTYQCLNKALKSNATRSSTAPDLGAGSLPENSEFGENSNSNEGTQNFI